MHEGVREWGYGVWVGDWRVNPVSEISTMPFIPNKRNFQISYFLGQYLSYLLL